MVTFYYVAYIKATPEELWGALINPDFTEKYWWGRRLTTDWKEGSQIKALHDGNKTDWQGKVLIFKPYSKLSYTFHLEEVPEIKNDEHSIVTFEIIPETGTVVKLVVTHENLSQRAFDDVSNGWPAILSSIKSLLETGETLENTQA